jgi:hypothetical protein
MLKKSLLTLLAALSLVSGALAGGGFSYRIGNFDYYSGSGGASYSGYRIGNNYYWSGTDGNGQYHSGSSYRIGNTTYYNSDDN